MLSNGSWTLSKSAKLNDDCLSATTAIGSPWAALIGVGCRIVWSLPAADIVTGVGWRMFSLNPLKAAGFGVTWTEGVLTTVLSSNTGSSAWTASSGTESSLGTGVTLILGWLWQCSVVDSCVGLQSVGCVLSVSALVLSSSSFWACLWRSLHWITLSSSEKSY